jgi:hypothetical protein
MAAEMALQLASKSLAEREERDFQRWRENPPSPANERRLLLTAKRFHTVCKNYETGRKALLHKGFLLFLTPPALSAAVSENHAVANDRDTSDSGRCWSDFWRPLDGENAPGADLRREDQRAKRLCRESGCPSGRHVALHMTEVAISRNLFADILRMIAELRPRPLASSA